MHHIPILEPIDSSPVDHSGCHFMCVPGARGLCYAVPQPKAMLGEAFANPAVGMQARLVVSWRWGTCYATVVARLHHLWRGFSLYSGIGV